MKKNLEIEALRGLAVLAVVIGHLPNALYWVPGLPERLGPYGFGAGVDLFFVISGYVITLAFYDELQNSAQDRAAFFVNVRRFMVRRLFRVMPAALFWLMVVCTCSVWFNGTGIFGDLRHNFNDLLAVALNVSNVYFAKCLAAGPPQLCGYNSVYWSVSLEEQFYLLFPLLVLLPKRFIVVATCAVVVALVVIDRTLLVWFTRVDGLLAGVCLAFFTRTRFHRSLGTLRLARPELRVALMSGLAGAILWLPVAGIWIPRLYPELMTLCCLLMVGLASFDRQFAFGRGPWQAALAYVGTRSFAIYLIHNPAAWLTREISARAGLLNANQVPTQPLLFTATVFLLLFALSELTFRFVESPWRRWGRLIAGPPAKPRQEPDASIVAHAGIAPQAQPAWLGPER